MEIAITYNLNEFLKEFSNNSEVKSIKWVKENKLDIQKTLSILFGGYWSYNPTLKMVTHQYSK